MRFVHEKIMLYTREQITRFVLEQITRYPREQIMRSVRELIMISAREHRMRSARVRVRFVYGVRAYEYVCTHQHFSVHPLLTILSLYNSMQLPQPAVA